METTDRVHSQGLRIWHWLDAIVIIGLITTFFLREGLVSRSRYLVKRLGETGIAADQAQFRPIIREMVDQLWVWHVWMGYALTALFIVRIVLFFTDKTHPVKECWQLVCRARENFDFRNVHSAAVKSSYILFYVLQLFMILSGLTLALDEALPLSQAAEDLIHEGHELVMWFFLAFSIAHIVGMFAVENMDEPGIVSAMINGRQRPDETRK